MAAPKKIAFYVVSQFLGYQEWPNLIFASFVIKIILINLGNDTDILYDKDSPQVGLDVKTIFFSTSQI